MANQEQNPLQQEQPFVAAKQVSFNLKDILLNTNNEVALLYPEHTNKETFKCVSDFISKSLSLSPLVVSMAKPWFKIIGYGETVPAKGTLKKSLLPPRWSEATKGGSSKRPTGSKTSHLKRKKESSSAMDSNLSQTSASTPVVAEMHKEDQQATGGPTSLGVTSEERANPQLNSAEADPGKYAPSDFIPQQQGMNEGTKNTSYDYLFIGTDPHVLADKTYSVSEVLETFLTQPITGKGASSIARQVKEDEAPRTINDEDKESDEVHAITNAETEDASVPKSSFPRSSQIQELTNQVLIL
ncbi:hypothetical protein Tco_0557123 [Tanacetum coccineum]